MFKKLQLGSHFIFQRKILIETMQYEFVSFTVYGQMEGPDIQLDRPDRQIDGPDHPIFFKKNVYTA